MVLSLIPHPFNSTFELFPKSQEKVINSYFKQLIYPIDSPLFPQSFLSFSTFYPGFSTGNDAVIKSGVSRGGLYIFTSC